MQSTLPAARAELRNPPPAGPATHVGLDQVAHFVVRPFEFAATVVEGDTRDEECRHKPLETMLAGVRAQRYAKRGGFDPGFEITDPVVVALRLAMHRVLQRLDHPLEV